MRRRIHAVLPTARLTIPNCTGSSVGPHPHPSSSSWWTVLGRHVATAAQPRTGTLPQKLQRARAFGPSGGLNDIEQVKLMPISVNDDKEEVQAGKGTSDDIGWGRSERCGANAIARFSSYFGVALEDFLPNSPQETLVKPTVHQEEERSPVLALCQEPLLPARAQRERFTTTLPFQPVGVSFDELTDEPVLWIDALEMDLPAAIPITLKDAQEGRWRCSVFESGALLPSEEDCCNTTTLLTALRRGMPNGEGQHHGGAVLRYLSLERYRGVMLSAGVEAMMSKDSAFELPMMDPRERGGDNAGAPSLLSPSFPFYEGKGTQTVKSYFDIRPEVLAQFAPSLPQCSKHCTECLVKHGNKVFFPGGSAVCVGVRMCSAGSGTGDTFPAVFWVPSGSNGCVMVPQIHADPTLAFRAEDGSDEDRSRMGATFVGEVQLTPNGPNSALLDELASSPKGEFGHLTRYLQTSGNLELDGEKGCDTGDWLCEGLFGLKAGSPVPGCDPQRFVVVGVAVDSELDELALYCRDNEAQQKSSGRLSSVLLPLPLVLMLHADASRYPC